MMIRLQTVIIIVLCVVILALAAILFVVYQRPVTQTASAPMKSPAPTQQAPVSAQPPQLSPEVERFLHAPKDPAAMMAEQKMRKDKADRLMALQARFKALSANGKTPDADELDKLLNELIEIQGTSVIAGVDLNVLRQNLRVAQKIQALAKDLEAEGKKPKPDQNRILEITKEIQAEQTHLNTNMMVGGVNPSAGAPMSPPAVNAPNAGATKNGKGQ